MTHKKYDIKLWEKRNKIPINLGFHRKSRDKSQRTCSGIKNKCDSGSSRDFSYFQLYRYTTTSEKFLLIVGILFATMASLGIPYSLVNTGRFHTLLVERHTGDGTSSDAPILNLFGGGKILTNSSMKDNMEALGQDALAYGIASLVGGIMQWIFLAASIDIFNRVSVKQINRIRKRFLESIIRQDMSWYDTTSENNFTSKMTEDLSKLKEGIGEKVPIFTKITMSFFSSMLVCFFFGLHLTLIILACCPIIIVSTLFVERIQSSLTKKELISYCAASSVAEEVFSGIRTVFAFGGERKESERYNELLLPAVKAGQRKGLCCGICSGVMWAIMYLCFGITLWFGAKLAVSKGEVETPAVVVNVLMGIILEAQNIGFALPHFESFAAAKSAGRSIFTIIDRKSVIDPLSDGGAEIPKFEGNIDFERVHFSYPSRPDVEVLKGLSLSIKAGQTVAFVGPSGCGKTTCLQLLQRFYDPESGSVKFDKKDIRELNVAWLRSQIGVVGQEPVLFSTTIEENIRFGNPTISKQEIEDACRMANCHDFISQLPDGYSTMVGELGCMMSGGQKQRIAIARALVKNPKILLLDEATSALDSSNEKLVQKALDTARRGRTTLMVAHRLSTIRDADIIIFVKDGTVMEQGNHFELLALEGYYYGLMQANERGGRTSEPRSRKTSCGLIHPVHKDLEEEKNDKDHPIKGANKLDFLKTFLKFNAPEWKYLLVGCIACVLQGFIRVIWIIYFGEFIGFLSHLGHGFKKKVKIIAMITVAIGIFTGLAHFVHIYVLNVAGANLTSRLRQMAFKSIVSQDMRYFDSQNNSVGALCSRLSGDCSNVQGATGSRLGVMIQSLATLLFAIIMSLAFSWNLTIATLVLFPCVVCSVMFESNYRKRGSESERFATENASQIAVEAVANIETVNSLGQEKYVLERYSKYVDLADEAFKDKTRFRGTVFGFGDASPFVALGISLFYGGLLVADGKIEYKNIIKISEALQLGTWMLGQAFAYAPDVNEAKYSFKRLLKLFDRVPTITSRPQLMNTKNLACEKFDINYNNVEFNYPTRKLSPIFENFNLKISKGSTVALVGASGCGKSTCVQLLLRFYDPISGSVNLNAVPTNEYKLETLRSYIGLVSQEPVLFDRTIAENIAYGDNSRESIPMTEIIDSAKKSNIHDFIASLPQGYGTSVSSKGSQLSCGQKQRIAIARALVRNPRILVLDEATSALDMQSEKMVQEALDTARSGRTCLVIAQRLATIRNADMICVIENGCVKEQGTHKELMKLKGVYAELLSVQQ